MGFKGDDTFGEHIDTANMKSISEILEPILVIIAMIGNCDQIFDLATQTLRDEIQSLLSSDQNTL